MPTNVPYISVVVPVFNGSASLEALFGRVKAVFDHENRRFEVIFVDDGSTDNSWPLIERLQAQFPESVRGIRLMRNAGQQAATFCGLLEASGEWIVTMDDDLQVPPEEIPKLLEAARGRNTMLVYGVSSEPARSLFYRAGARLFRRLLRSVALDFPDGSSFRLLHSGLVERLPKNVRLLNYIDPLLSWVSSGVLRVEVRHEKRQHGRSGYSFLRLLGLALEILLLYSVLPLRFMVWLGLLCAVGSFGLGVYYLMLKLTVGAQVGFSALIVTITFFSGMILMSLGILGTYISNLYAMGIGRPAFVIQQKI